MGGGAAPRLGRFTSGKDPVGGPRDRSGRVPKISPLPEFDPRTIQPVASRYTDWAIPALQKYIV